MVPKQAGDMGAQLFSESRPAMLMALSPIGAFQDNRSCLALVHCPRHKSANSAEVFESQLLLRYRLGGVSRRYRAHFHRTVVAALDVRMPFVAGDHYKSVRHRVLERRDCGYTGRHTILC
jgi:hypothetical protein